MRTHRAIAVLVLALAAVPAGFAKSSVTIDASALRITPLTEVTKKEQVRSCQAGASRSRIRLPGPAAVTQSERRAATVACEQPPKGNLNVAGSLAATNAAAVAGAG